MAIASVLQSDHFSMLDATLHFPTIAHPLAGQEPIHAQEAERAFPELPSLYEQNIFSQADPETSPCQAQAGEGAQEPQEQLVTRALQGDQRAFAEIVDQYSALMLRTAIMIVGDQDTAEDIVQDAFIQAWHHLPELRRAGALRPWLMRIVVNQCISLKRRAARTAAFIRQVLSEHEINLLAQVADDHHGRMERDWDLAQAITLLPLKQRVVIVLHYYYSMTLPEMARTLHTSENTLKKRIQAALVNLRRLLGVSNDIDPSVFPAA